MQLVSFQIKCTAFTHLELSLLEMAKVEIKAGISIEKLEKVLSTELSRWREKMAKYRNAPTAITKEGRSISMSHHGKVIVVFTPLA